MSLIPAYTSSNLGGSALMYNSKRKTIAIKNYKKTSYT